MQTIRKLGIVHGLKDEAISPIMRISLRPTISLIEIPLRLKVTDHSTISVV
jgi:hypothetical protein